MKNTLKLLYIIAMTALITTESIQAVNIPTVDLPMGEELVTNLCFDGGYIRRKNFDSNQNITPILRKVILKFVDGSEYIKNEFITSEYTYYDGDSKTFKKVQISECVSQLVEKSFVVEEKHKKATVSESTFYGNLRNYGVADSAAETWKKWGSLERYLRYSAEKDRVTLVSNFSDLSEQSQLNDFLAWKDLSGKVIGGEQSGGGGAGKVRINMNMPATDLIRHRYNTNFLERAFGLDSTLNRIIYDNKKISKSKIWVTVPRK